MSARSRMTHRAQIQRQLHGGPDGYNHPTPLPFDNLGEPVPCYAWVTGKRTAVTSDRTAVIEDFRAIVPLGTDVTETTDRLASITDRLEEELFPGPIKIEAVERRKDHIELLLQRVA